MKYILSLFLSLFLFLGQAQAAPAYACNCADATDPMQTTCNLWKGSTSYNGLSRYPGKMDDGVTVNSAYGPKLKLSELRTSFSTIAAGSTAGACTFGKWPVIDQASGGGEAIQNFSAINGSRTNPVTLGSYNIPGLNGDSGSGGTVTYTVNTVTDTSKNWNTVANGGLGQWAGWEISVPINDKYRHFTQILRIASNTATTLTFRSGGLAWESMLDEVFVEPYPSAGNAYTIRQAQPEIVNVMGNLAATIGFNPGTLSHREGYVVTDWRLVSATDGAQITSMVVNTGQAGTVTVTTSTAHGLTSGDLAAIINTTCASCDVPYRMNKDGATVTVTDSTHFTFVGDCNASFCPVGATGVGAPTMFYRKSGLRAFSQANDQDFVTLDNMTFIGGAIAIQNNAGATGNYTKSGQTDGITSNLSVLNSRIMKVSGHAFLASGNGLYAYGNLFYENGTDIFQHHIYVGGSTTTVQPNAVTSISGNGTTTTVTMTSATDMDSLEHMTMTWSNSATVCSTSGTIAHTVPTIPLITFVDSTHFTYPSACSGTAIPPTTLTITKEMDIVNVTIARNTMVYGNVGGAGKCRSVSFVIHGRIKAFNILDNDMYEPGTTAGCWGIVPSTGLYSEPASEELLENFVISGNRLHGYDLPIGVDICHNCVVANNLIVQTRGGNAGIVAPVNGSGYLTTQRNNKLRIMNNTIMSTAPTATSSGIRMGRDGSGHIVLGNVIFFSTGWTTATAYVCTDCVQAAHTGVLAPAAFANFDYNFGYAQGQAGTKPAWNSGTMNGGALGNIVRDTLTKMIDVGFDTHSSDTCNFAPTYTAPTTTVHWDVDIASGTCMHLAGHPTIQPYDSLFMRKRVGPPSTPGAQDPTASVNRLPLPVRNHQ